PPWTIPAPLRCSGCGSASMSDPSSSARSMRNPRCAAKGRGHMRRLSSFRTSPTRAGPWRPSGGRVGDLPTDGLLAPGKRPVRADKVAGVAVGIVLEVVLVLGLGLPERAGRLDLGDDLAGPDARR